MKQSESWDVIVIGAGIAGISIASNLSKDANVLVLECEESPMVHSTSRSAAMHIESYTDDPMEHFIRASRPFFVTPPTEFCNTPLSSSRGTLTIGYKDQHLDLKKLHTKQTGCKLLTADDLQDRVSAIRAENYSGGILDNRSLDIDVNQLCQSYLRSFRENAGKLRCNVAVKGLQQHSDLWTLETNVGSFTTPIVINACGAWCDEIAEKALDAPIGLVPYRRTVAIVEFEKPANRDWPMTENLNGDWYAAPQGEWMLISLNEETPMPPCDVWPEDIDVATAIDNFQQEFDLGEVVKVVRSWAGLRTFSPDRQPVVGFDQRAKGFFWLAGQGGSGIHSAPALSNAAAALITGNVYPDWMNISANIIDNLSPDRFVDKSMCNFNV